MEIKNLIEKRIEDKGFTKKSFAQEMGISPTNLNSMITSPSYPTLVKVAKVLNMTLSELLDESEPSEATAQASALFVCPHCGKEIKVTLNK